MAQRAADEFHQSWKSHPDGKLSVRTAPLFYQSAGPTERQAYFAQVRAALGAPVSSSTVGVHVDKMPAGTFLSARYETRFEHGIAQENSVGRLRAGNRTWLHTSYRTPSLRLVQKNDPVRGPGMSSRQMKSALGSAALVGLIVSLAVHVATSIGIDVYSQFPPVWVLHIASIALFGAFVVYGGHRLKLDEVTTRVPTWAVLVVAATIAYVVVDSVVCAHLAGAGNASLLEGQYVLTSHGRVLAHISERDYHLHRATELRLLSGIWLVACLVSTVYFLLWREDRNADGR